MKKLTIFIMVSLSICFLIGSVKSLQLVITNTTDPYSLSYGNTEPKLVKTNNKFYLVYTTNSTGYRKSVILIGCEENNIYNWSEIKVLDSLSDFVLKGFLYYDKYSKSVHTLYKKHLQKQDQYGLMVTYLQDYIILDNGTALNKLVFSEHCGAVSLTSTSSKLYLTLGKIYNGNLFMMVSEDGGLSWSRERVVLPKPSGFNYVQSSWITADRKGVLHVLSCVSYYANGNKMACFYSRSEDGDESWSEPVMISKNPGSFDRAWHGYILVDSNDTLYFTYHYTDGKTHLRRSEDGGRTWGGEKVFPYHGYFGLDSEDTLYYYYVANGDFFLMKSRDKGETWSEPENVSKNGKVVSTGLLLLNNDEPGFISVWVEEVDGDYQIVMALPGEREIPKPTNRSLVITDLEWKNVLSVAPIKLPVIVTSSIDEEVVRYIEGYKPDYIYTLGFDLGRNNSFRIGYWDVPKLFFPNASKKIYVDTRENGIYASALAFLKEWPLVFERENGSLDLSKNTSEEIHEMFLREINKTGEGINYFVLTNLNHPASLLAGRLAGIRKAYIIGMNLSEPIYPERRDLQEGEAAVWNERNGVSGVKEAIRKGFIDVNTKGLVGINSLIEGYFMGILPGIPFVVEEDPVEKGSVFRDEEDGNWFLSDLEYGKMDSDYMVFAVGRFPENPSLSILINKILFPENKTGNALVAGEYLHKYWPEVLVYLGGGLWQAKTLDEILSSQGYNTTRLVEYRADVRGLVQEMMPGEILGFIRDTDELAGKLSQYLGSGLSKVISSLSLFLKLTHLLEEGLEVYLEYDWGSWELNYQNMERFLESIQEDPPEDMEGVVARVIESLLPERFPELTKMNLLEHMPESEIIYYEGYGNGTAWILPNEFDELNPWDSPYDGRNFLGKEEIPWLETQIVWDNSNLGVRGIGREFLSKGSQVYIGSSGVSYHPYTSELDTRFFLQEKTIGEAFKNAINGFLDDSFTFDLINWILRGDTVKAKTLKEFVVYGDPKTEKDPVILKGYEPEVNTTCEKGFCITRVVFQPEYRIKEKNGTRTLEIKTLDFLLRDFKPILPLLKYEFYLSEDSEVYGYEERDESLCAGNLSFPVLIPWSHGRPVKPNVSLETGKYPETYYRFSVHRELDGRKRVLMVVSPVQRINDSCWRIYKKVEFRINHTLPVRVRIEAENIEEGENQTIRIWIDNKEGFGKEVITEITNGMGGWKFNESLEEGENGFKYGLEGLNAGSYRIRVWVLGESVFGPVIKYFQVWTKPRLRWRDVEGEIEEGETGVLELELKDESWERVKNITLRISDLVSEKGRIGKGNMSFLENNFTLSPGEEKIIEMVVKVPDMQPSGVYKGRIWIETENDGAHEVNVSVRIPERIEFQVWGEREKTIFPGKNDSLVLEVRNTGNVFAEVSPEVLGFDTLEVWSTGEIRINPGEETQIRVWVKVPGGTREGEYSGILKLGKEKIEIKILVPGVVYWKVEPKERECELPGNCSVWFLISNSQDSNLPLIGEIEGNGLGMKFPEEIRVEAGEEKRIWVNVSPSEIEEGLYRIEMNISVIKGIPGNRVVQIVVRAIGPEVKVRKRFIPRAWFGFPWLWGVVSVKVRDGNRVWIKEDIPDGFSIQGIPWVWVIGKSLKWVKASERNGSLEVDLRNFQGKWVFLVYRMVPQDPKPGVREVKTLVRAYKGRVYREREVKTRLRVW